MVSIVSTTNCKMLCPLYLEIDTTKIYGEINIKIRGFSIQTFMSLSKPGNLDKNCLPVMRAMRGLQTVMWGRQGLLTIIERSIIGGV